MKPLHLSTLLLALCFSALAQTRMPLLEEFTGESCMPCAAVNPALDAMLEQPGNISRIIAIKWQVPIPAAPPGSTSLYQTNKAEIDWRYKGVSVGGYGYPSQYSPSNTINDGILNAPTCFIDGKNQWNYGADTDHPYYFKNNIITAAAAVPTPFSIAMATSWNSAFNNCVVSVSVTSSSAFSAAGNLMFRLCLVEREIEFAIAPGFNGEKKFKDVVRSSYPTVISGGLVTNMGTSLPSSFTAGQMHVFTVNCAIPSYIMDKSQMAFVGFVQDDGDKKIYQAARTSQPAIPNDAMAEAVNIPLVVCAANITPSVTIKNNGATAITALTITPIVDGTPGADINWTGNIPGGASALLPMAMISVTTGTHTYGYTISNVSGGDSVLENNHTEFVFSSTPNYFAAPLSEGFESGPFPPANWIFSNTGPITPFYNSMQVGGYGQSIQSLAYPLFYAGEGEIDEFCLPPVNLGGTINSELKFDLAYQQLNTSKDSLKVFLSSDCGSNWIKIYSNGGASMATSSTPVNNSSFSPSAAEWTTHIIPLVGYAGAAEVLVKFQLRADGGNGIFLDNFNLKGGTGMPSFTGISTIAQNDPGFTLYPNPANSSVILVTPAASGERINVALLNSLGQVVYIRSGLSSGENSIDCRNFPAGIYFVKLDSENGSGIKKLVISK